MKILLIRPPHSPYSSLISKVEVPAFPFDIAYLASFLKVNGIDVYLMDFVAGAFSEKEIRQSLSEISADIVGITTYTSSIFNAYSIAQIVKNINKNVKIVFGGHHASALPEEILKNEAVDYVVIGEGELTLFELVKNIDEKKEPSDIKGLAFRYNGNIIRTPPRPLIQDLDKLPFPERDLLPIEKYSVHLTRYKGKGRSGAIMASRGCCFRCAFCSKAVFGESYRHRSVENVMDELRKMRDQYNIDQVTFHDNIFTFKRDFVIKLCQKMIDEQVNIRWTCQTRVNLIDNEVLSVMKQAGCTLINFGIETGSDRIMEGLSNKKITKVMVREAINLCRNNKIDFECGFIFGHPDETIEMAEETIKFAKELKPDIASFFILTPLPGTHYYEIAKEKNVVDPSKYDRLIALPKGEPVFVISKMNPKELLAIQKKAYKEYYLNLGYILRRILKIRSIKDLKNNLIGMLTIHLLK